MTVQIDLDDKFTKTEGRVFLNGVQALARIPMAQIRRDRAAGLNTGAFISGYRGSPLGSFDQTLQRFSKFLDPYDIRFQPGVNEELAATAVWGSQQLHLSPGAKKDGVVGMWYGKGPGVDRSGDVFKHANAAGTSKHGGVLALAGDDHGAKSSTVPHQSDHAFMSAIIPVLYPSSIHEFIEFGLLGIAMSRFAGVWVGFKVIADTVETTAQIDLATEARQFVIPEDFELPPDGLNLRAPDDRWVQDHRLQSIKGYAAIAFGRANKVDKIVIDSSRARFGIVASGKAYEDVREALRELEIDEATAERIGLRLYKVGMPWPLEPEGIRHFSEGLNEVLVVEERREIIEFQIKQQLFNWRADVRPRIIGKFDHEDKPNLPLDVELTVGTVARAIADRLHHLELPSDLMSRIEEKLDYFSKRKTIRDNHQAPIARLPYYCSGCPHNTSTRVPEGSRALAGIGCHFMTLWMDRGANTYSQMGGEGVAWTGAAPFTDEEHVFTNLGDGTYFHSGSLAIRQAVSSGANITYKILYNDAVAMTGGQHVDGTLTVPQLCFQVYHEGVKAIRLLSEKPELYKGVDLPPGCEPRHRDAIDPTMEELRKIKGCTILVFDQTCAAEKRRRRKRKLMEDPQRRVFINPLVCEGCGDCSVQSNCVSVEPLETEFGRKRQINQSSCNKDYSCLKGFCPSFVTIEGGGMKKHAPAEAIDPATIPDPARLPSLDKPYNIAITGVGGTGVLTIGAIIGMAAHIEGKASMILDMAGLAQKGGAVLSHVRLARSPEEVTSPRIVTGGADLLLAADDVVAASRDGIVLCRPERTHGVVNTHNTPVAGFVLDRDIDFRRMSVRAMINRNVTSDEDFLDFTKFATYAAGDAIATNIMIVGYACQKGLLPISRASIEQAIELNGVAVKSNLAAFTWGRLIAHDHDAAVEKLGLSEAEPVTAETMSLDELIAHRSRELTAYQNRKLARRYEALVRRVREAAADAGLGDELPRAVAVSYYKLLAYKDEYEVARLFTTGDFEKRIADQFDGDFTLKFHLAPPVTSKIDPNTGRPRKKEFGPKMLGRFRLLKRFKFLRGTFFDPFGRSEERRTERELIKWYAHLVDEALPKISRDREAALTAFLSLPVDIRGYGPVKMASIDKAKAREQELLKELDAPADKPAPVAAE